MIQPTSLSQLSPADRARMRLRDEDLIHVCSVCRTVSCANRWCAARRLDHGLAVIEVTIGELRRSDPREHTSYWIHARTAGGYALPERLAITLERLNEIDARCAAIAAGDGPTWLAFPDRARLHAEKPPLFKDGSWAIVRQNYEMVPLAVVDRGDDHDQQTRRDAEPLARFLAESGADVPDLAREVRESWAREAELRERVEQLEAAAKGKP